VRIVLAHKFYRPVGGTEEFVRQLEGLLTGHGHEVAPFAMAHPDDWPTPYARYFVPEIDYRAELSGVDRARRAVAATSRLIYWREARRRFALLLDDVRPDVVHVQNIAHQISPSILYAAAERHIPVVMTVNDFKLVCPTSSMINGRTGTVCSKCFGGRYWNVVRDRCHDGSLAGSLLLGVEMTVHHRLLRVYERHIRLFLAENQTRRRTLEAGGIPARRIRVLTQPFDAGPYRPQPFGRSRFLYFGRLDPDKGVDALVEAAAIAGVDVDVVGRGTEEPALRALAERIAPGRVTFHGPRYGGELEGLVAGSCATVLPSRQMEGTPYAVLQSFAWGRGMVVTDVGSLPEVVEHERSGLVVPSGDVPALARALRRLVDEPGLAATLGAHARDDVLARYSPETYYELLLAAYADAGVRGIQATAPTPA
jgi:glycosyltransferase involved in cell wall biosynthesis